MYLFQPSTGCIKQLLFSSIYLFQQGKKAYPNLLGKKGHVVVVVAAR